MRRLRLLLTVPLLALLAGCNMVVLSPSGDVAAQQRDLVVASTILMLLIIIPVMALTVFFAWKYRAANKGADYRPGWHHSTQLELVIWAAPLLIIICLGAMTWASTHLLDPYRPLPAPAEAAAKTGPVAVDDRPLRVDVVALDWKWLFIYPDEGIATVNEMAAPVGRQISFHITSSSVMNSFYVPALAGQIYAMAGMQTVLHAVIDKPGDYKGFSANYSGAGFSGMHFRFKGLSDADFASWVKQAADSGAALDRDTYLKLAKPSENVPVSRFAKVDDGLFGAIVNMCVEPGKMCMNDMAAIDSRGGLGKAGIANWVARGERQALSGRAFVNAICTTADPHAMAGMGKAAAPVPGLSLPVLATGPLRGAGLPRPSASPFGASPAGASPAAMQALLSRPSAS